MKRIISLCVIAFLSSCTSFDDALKTDTVTLVEFKIEVSSLVSDIEDVSGLEVNLENYKENKIYKGKLKGTQIVFNHVIPGLYNLNISGRLSSSNGEQFLMRGAKNNFPIVKADYLEVDIDGIRISPLVFKEIFYAGTAPFYFRNQFYEIYNNSDQVIYLDQVYFATIAPTKATTQKPIWPAEDQDKFVYTERIWKFPGSGTDYPLLPGESCVISQFAANHKLERYNPNSPLDATISEFEFNMENPNFPDQPAIDMEHIYYNGKAVKGSAPQYLTSVFGGAFVLFSIPEDKIYDPINNLQLQAKDASSSLNTIYAKIPINYVLDAVEAGDNENMIVGKRMPSVLDAGMTYVGATYNSKSVVRKKISENADGTPILQDLNNSSEDFIHGEIPVFRRYGAKMPKWNHTLK
ncbi:DUF4876 domain-containing protein [Myroides odoratimimus]|uniref:DUF4876 domain-containing protein n=1 Tax=Myroides odoratimimus TaxID=76832 RepID=UPI000468F506|nr:DUF4876 domain-containing protein [Myroides odoratimimus]